ncbi:putative chromatin binding protein [Trypanosoma conorhini]|uniref:Putative chromatin binding protein n=1 Tax=Trypanosoma conorhini TaxID=83891 RepID=A0A3R7M0K1_9TRYP|nr:putative chromatin binding protein [Trypanosoma conorhini]RNF24278.1 putative chromatin binding protein [Trypanosoma conorhini]
MEAASRIQHDPAAQNASPKVAIAVCGCGNDGRLGLGTFESKSRITVLPFFLGTVLREGDRGATEERGAGETVGSIRAVRVGGYHNFVITTTGVYGWGLNEHGQLGLGRGSAASVPLPTRIPFFDGETVIDIQCGAYHTLAWTKRGLFVCGKNSDGQLGLPAEDDHHSFATLLTAAQVNDSDVREGDEIGGCRLIQRGQLTHMSCGTHHTLLAFADVVVVREGNDEMQQQQYPLLIAAAGKGDFGELGYDGDAWSVLRAKAKTMQYALCHGLQLHQEESDADAHLRISLQKKWKPMKPRRAPFSSSCFQPVVFPLLLEQMVTPSGMCSREIVSLRAMHLHSSALLRENKFTEKEPGDAGRIRTFHWGCYYCDVLEDDASSIPREEAKEGVSLHAGNEALFRYTTTPPAEVEVMGSGVLGLGAEDSFVPVWTPLPLPHEAKNLSIRAMTGREHYLILLENTLVIGFGDNMHGQLGIGESEDVVLCPTVLLRTGDEVKSAVPFAGECRWKIQSIRDAACGVRHSVYLVEVCRVSSAN